MKKHGLYLCLALVMTLLVSFVAAPIRAEEAEPEVKTLYLFHTNDVHGRAEGDAVPGKDGLPLDSGSIGYARYKGVLNTFRELYDDSVLCLDCGDTTHGTNFATLSHGQSVIRIMNQIGVDAMVTGNHEYNYGIEDLELNAKEADFPVLVANLVKEDDESLLFEAYKIFERQGLKIGVFGLATPETKVKSSPKNTEGLSFEDPVTVARDMVAKLQEEGVDLIVCICHLGVDEESEVTSELVAQEAPGIDVILDGHSHTEMPEGRVVGDTLIAQTGSHFHNIGLVSVTFTDSELSDKTARLISFQEAIQYPEDEEVKASIDAIDEENERITSVVVGKSEVDLDGEREHVRTTETNLSNLVVDALLAAAPGADCAISNGGNVRTSLPAGDITKGDLLAVLPFENTICVLEVTGQDIADALAYGTDAYPGTAGKFPNVANMTYELVKKDDKYVVENITVGGEPIDLEKTYKLATNDFMAIGGDGYEMLADKPEIMVGGLLVDAFEAYIQELSGDKGSFSAEADGRIKVVESAE